MTTLSVHGLRKAFVRHLQGSQERLVLRGADLQLEPGTMTVLRGPSGSGKSSLLRCIYRAYLPDAGSIVLSTEDEAIDLAAAGDWQVLDVRRRLMGMATQFLRVTPRVPAVDLVAEEAGDRERAGELLVALGLPPELLSAPPATFSGGERQLVNLAIAIARDRPLLLLDEATASLDPQRRRRVLAVLAEQKSRGTTMLAVFHDLPRSRGLFDRVVEMREGKVVG